jgi:transcriptional regulator with XRE-family HTH domain
MTEPLADYEARYKKFLEKLRHARKLAGLSQYEVAHALGKPQSYVSKCETGERRIDVVELAEFASLYKQPVEFFIDQPDLLPETKRPIIDR